jgi:endoglucanase
MAGLNVAGAEFGKAPGRYGHTYIYPAEDALARYAGLGFNVIRLPFLWERIQTVPFGELNGPELGRLKTTIAAAARHGLDVILDVHNYARRKLAADGWTGKHLIGSPELPAEALADLWSRLAMEFITADAIQYGLMNEPHGLPARDWLRIANGAIGAIRKTGARQLIHVPGVAYTGAHSWLKSGNVVMAEVDDPARHFVIDVHQYLDRDSSGTTAETVSPTIGSERISAFQNWARRERMKAFLGEFGAASTETGLAALDDLCRTLKENGDVWIGWAAWAAGPWWPARYHFRLEPARDGTLPPALEVLSKYAHQINERAASQR